MGVGLEAHATASDSWEKTTCQPKEISAHFDRQGISDCETGVQWARISARRGACASEVMAARMHAVYQKQKMKTQSCDYEQST